MLPSSQAQVFPILDYRSHQKYFSGHRSRKPEETQEISLPLLPSAAETAMTSNQLANGIARFPTVVALLPNAGYGLKQRRCPPKAAGGVIPMKMRMDTELEDGDATSH
jgi:hypothetical protein